MMMRNSLILMLAVLLSLFFCQQNDSKPTETDDLNNLKKEFLSTIGQAEVEEGPFHLNYKFRTVFFSKELISLFGELSVHDRLPHGWQHYEGKTYCNNSSGKRLVDLKDLFPTREQQEFLRRYCEKALKEESISFFSDKYPSRMTLSQQELRTFVVDDRCLIIVFQPYSVGGLNGPIHIKIPYSDLEEHWDPSNPVIQALRKVLPTKEFTSSWDVKEYYQRLSDGFWE